MAAVGLEDLEGVGDFEGLQEDGGRSSKLVLAETLRVGCRKPHALCVIVSTVLPLYEEEFPCELHILNIIIIIIKKRDNCTTLYY